MIDHSPYPLWYKIIDMAEKKKGKRTDGAGAELPVRFMTPDGMPSAFVDRVVIQTHQGMLHVDFYQTEPPHALTPEELQAVEEIRTFCQGRFVMTPQTLASFIDVFKKALDVVKQRKPESNDDK
jgi:hypothetical protein